MIRVGMMIYGYCNGYFGRDSYEPKRIEALGHDWVVVREEEGFPNFARFNSSETMEKLLAEWAKEEVE